MRGYREYRIGWKNYGLAYNEIQIARTDDELCIAYEDARKEHLERIQEFAEENECTEIEWRAE